MHWWRKLCGVASTPALSAYSLTICWTLLVGYDDGSVRLWDLASSKEKVTMPEWTGDRRQVTQVAFSPDGMRMAACRRDQGVALYDAASGRLINVIAEGHPTKHFAFGGDGSLLGTTIFHGRQVDVWTLPLGKHWAEVDVQMSHTAPTGPSAPCRRCRGRPGRRPPPRRTPPARGPRRE